MPQLIMYWDGVDALGESTSGLEILNSGSQSIDIPNDACGFRLGTPGEPWYGAWYFTPEGSPGSTFKHFGISYSSAFTGQSPDAIEAQGPVHGCQNGLYQFHTPLAQYGISGDDPVVNGASSFVAEFTSEDDITWLNSVGEAVEVETPFGEDPESPTLPPEFFEEEPEVEGCFRDFLGQLQCPDLSANAEAPTEAPSLPFATGTLLTATFLTEAFGTIIPRFRTLSQPGVATTAASSKVEVECPAELVLTVTFDKNASVNPATVLYRFRFAHGPISTTFSTVVDQDGPNQIHHSVPIPLPMPISPGSGGTSIPPSTITELAVIVRPDDVGPGSGSPPQQRNQSYQIEPLPENEHRGSVRVEILNGSAGTITSQWTSYHMVCVESSTRPTVRPGLISPQVTSLQAVLNRWLRREERPFLPMNGVFDGRTEATVKEFQAAEKLVADGIVGRCTWQALLGERNRTSAFVSAATQ